MYAITYSSSIDFIGSVLPNFRYAEIVFGNENVLEDDVAMLISAQGFFDIDFRKSVFDMFREK